MESCVIFRGGLCLADCFAQVGAGKGATAGGEKGAAEGRRREQ
jgi:hypothetical protein